MPLTKTTTTALFAAGAAAVLALAGCSGGADGGQDGGKKRAKSQGVVYDFTQINGMPAAKEITFEIPDALLKADPKYAEDRVLTSVTAKAHKLDSAEFCAVDLTYTFVDGARDRALNSKWYDRGGHFNSDPTPEEKINRTVGSFGKPTIGEPDPSKPDFGEGTYMSEDFQTITSVVECATGPTDSEDNTEVSFNQIEDVSRSNTVDVDEFASAEVAVMKNGDLHIVEGEVSDWMLDANGDWIHED